jgi:hypothetical protein
MMQPGGKPRKAIEGVKSLLYRASQTTEDYKADFSPESPLGCIKIIDPQGVNHTANNCPRLHVFLKS